MKKINKFVYIFLIIIFIAGIIPNVVVAWGTEQSSETECSPQGTAKIKVSFTNKENTRAINVEVKDQQTGKTINLGSVEAGKTNVGEIDTQKDSIADGTVTFFLTWTDNKDGSDKRTAKYKSISCMKPSITPTVSPEPTPTITITPTLTPTETPTPTLTPVPPTQTPSVGGGGHVSDGRSDGRSDSLGCLNTDCSNQQRGKVLGISTGVGLAGTGNYSLILGIISMGILSLSSGFLLRFRKGN